MTFISSSVSMMSTVVHVPVLRLCMVLLCHIFLGPRRVLTLPNSCISVCRLDRWSCCNRKRRVPTLMLLTRLEASFPFQFIGIRVRNCSKSRSIISSISFIMSRCRRRTSFQKMGCVTFFLVPFRQSSLTSTPP
jgi:hypothetical protein